MFFNKYVTNVLTKGLQNKKLYSLAISKHEGSLNHRKYLPIITHLYLNQKHENINKRTYKKHMAVTKHYNITATSC